MDCDKKCTFDSGRQRKTDKTLLIKLNDSVSSLAKKLRKQRNQRTINIFILNSWHENFFQDN